MTTLELYKAQVLFMAGNQHTACGGNTIKDRNGMDLTEAEGEGIGNPLQSYYLENPTQIGAWWGSKGSQRVGYK